MDCATHRMQMADFGMLLYSNGVSSHMQKGHSAPLHEESKMRNVLTAILSVALLASPAAAKPALRDVPAVDDALLDLGLADQIRKECPDISARFLRAISYLNNIHQTARTLGYTEAEIDAYRKSPVEKARMKARGAAYLEANGVDTSDPQSYCTLGRAEIQKSSRIGSLLRAK